MVVTSLFGYTHALRVNASDLDVIASTLFASQFAPVTRDTRHTQSSTKHNNPHHYHSPSFHHFPTTLSYTALTLPIATLYQDLSTEGRGLTNMRTAAGPWEGMEVL